MTLSPIARIAAGDGPTQAKARGQHRLGKMRVLGQKAVTRMHRISAGGLRSRDDGGHIQITFTGWWWPDAIRLVGITDMQRRPVSIRIDCGGAQPALAARAQNTDGDLAAVGKLEFY